LLGVQPCRVIFGLEGQPTLKAVSRERIISAHTETHQIIGDPVDGCGIDHALGDINIVARDSVIFPRALLDLLRRGVPVPGPIFRKRFLGREESVDGLWSVSAVPVPWASFVYPSSICIVSGRTLNRGAVSST
jgi:hypothetical protein